MQIARHGHDGHALDASSSWKLLPAEICDGRGDEGGDIGDVSSFFTAICR